MKLNSCLYIENRDQLPQVTVDQLAQYGADIICLTGGANGPVGQLLQAGQIPAAQALMDRLSGIFGDRLYVELQRHPVDGGLPEVERVTERPFVEMAYAMGLPLVATNDVYFPASKMYEAHDALICIADGAYVDQQEGRRRLTPQHYFKSQAEMATLFADLPEALANTVEIAKRCTLDLKLGEYFLPDYPIPEGMTKDSFFEKVSFEDLDRRLEKLLDSSATDYQAQRQVYLDRLRFELDIIIQMGFPGYFLIVMDFIRWAKDNDIPVGPGRGSGAGSLVAYALGITDLDPLEYDLLFERFLNPERVSMPDFDIDFCMDNRDRVIALSLIHI